MAEAKVVELQTELAARQARRQELLKLLAAKEAQEQAEKERRMVEAVVRKLNRPTPDDLAAAQECFEIIDTCGDDRISAAELKDAAKKYGCPIAEEHIDAAIQALDLDGDGLLNLDEFRAFWCSATVPPAAECLSVLKSEFLLQHYEAESRERLQTVHSLEVTGDTANMHVTAATMAVLKDPEEFQPKMRIVAAFAPLSPKEFAEHAKAVMSVPKYETLFGITSDVESSISSSDEGAGGGLESIGTLTLSVVPTATDEDIARCINSAQLVFNLLTEDDPDLFRVSFDVVTAPNGDRSIKALLLSKKEDPFCCMIAEIIEDLFESESDQLVDPHTLFDAFSFAVELGSSIVEAAKDGSTLLSLFEKMRITMDARMSRELLSELKRSMAEAILDGDSEEVVTQAILHTVLATFGVGSASVSLKPLEQAIAEQTHSLAQATRKFFALTPGVVKTFTGHGLQTTACEEFWHRRVQGAVAGHGARVSSLVHMAMLHLLGIALDPHDDLYPVSTAVFAARSAIEGITSMEWSTGFFHANVEFVGFNLTALLPRSMEELQRAVGCEDPEKFAEEQEAASEASETDEVFDGLTNRLFHFSRTGLTLKPSKLTHKNPVTLQMSFLRVVVLGLPLGLRRDVLGKLIGRTLDFAETRVDADAFEGMKLLKSPPGFRTYFFRDPSANVAVKVIEPIVDSAANFFRDADALLILSRPGLPPPKGCLLQEVVEGGGFLKGGLKDIVQNKVEATVVSPDEEWAHVELDPQVGIVFGSLSELDDATKQQWDSIKALSKESVVVRDLDDREGFNRLRHSVVAAAKASREARGLAIASTGPWDVAPV